MVTRKPVPSRVNGQAAPSAPYPTSPVAAPKGHGVANHAVPDAGNGTDLLLQRSRSSSASSHNTWNSGFSSDTDEGTNDQGRTEPGGLPASLRPGQPSQHLQSQNPYLHMQTQNQPQPQPQTPYGTASTHSSGPARPTAPPPAPPPAEPVELPTVRSPVDELGNLSLNHQEQEPPKTEALHPPAIPEKSSRRSLISHSRSSSNNPWQDDLDRERQRLSGASRSSASPSPQHVSQPLHEPHTRTHQPPPGPPPPESSPSPPAYPAPLTFPIRQPAHPAAPQPPAPQPPAPQPPAVQPPTPQPPVPPAAQIPGPPPSQPRNPPASQPPALPAFESLAPLIDLGTQEAPSTQPSRTPPAASPTVPPTAPTESPTEKLKKQRNETYQIKHINWLDASAGPDAPVRRSPILAQNANGPCPLLALVNALTLSTPESLQTVLVDALRSREQISLGLLIDAVFEELARRTEISNKELPDVGDLYSFLITLHTGMNVNPRFVASASTPQRPMPGSFEETREMRLYSTFDMPLIHGWVPSADSPAYTAFERSAKTFDEALNIQFAEAELEDKLNSDGLSAQEQQLFEDVHCIKHFLSSYPTQLTEHGLGIMSGFLKPGQIAILFRNDHFSTLYKEPRTGTLMTLVTDAGYSSHDEVVWESLVDISGAAGGLFSGDFRPVGNSSPSNAADTGAHNEQGGWQTAPSRNNQGSRNTGGAAADSSLPPTDGPRPRKTSEQEDADLALALQLQEEEEDNQRREQAERRRREDELSRQYLDREAASSGQRPPVPPRRSNVGNNAGTTTSNNAGTTTSSNAPPSADAPYVRASDGADDHPPSYEQAASDRPFRPSGSTPVQRQGDALGALTALQMQNSAFGAPQNNGTTSSTHPPYRRRSSGIALGRTNSGSQRMRRQHSNSQGAQQYLGYNAAEANRLSQAEREERCVLM